MFGAQQQSRDPKDTFRLDANDIVWFRRELEWVDTEVYNNIVVENKSRALIPTAQNIPDWAKTYTWREFKMTGLAKIVANMADDIPRADATGEEFSKIIKPIAASHAYDIFEIKNARNTGTRLDAQRAQASRWAVETKMDRVLALGDTTHKLDGLLTLTGVTTYTPVTKTGGGTAWTWTTPAEEIAADLFGIVTAIMTALKMSGGPVFQRYVIVLPIAQYAIAAQRRMGDGSDMTILRFVLANSPWIEAIEPWVHADGAGAGATDRMIAYPRNPMVLAAIVPQEYTQLDPDLRNFEYVINAYATTGGVVCRYPVAVGYADGI